MWNVQCVNFLPFLSFDIALMKSRSWADLTWINEFELNLMRDTRRRQTALRVTRRREAFVKGKTTTDSFDPSSDRTPYPRLKFQYIAYIAMNLESNSTQLCKWVESELSHVNKFGIWSESVSQEVRKPWVEQNSAPQCHFNGTTLTHFKQNKTCRISAMTSFRRRLSAEGAKPESNNRWKSDLGHVGGWVGMYVWYLELFRKPRHVAQQMWYQNVGLRNGHCLGTISAGCDF